MRESKFTELKGETDNSKISYLILAVDRTRQKNKTKTHTAPTPNRQRHRNSEQYYHHYL